jgi:plasmid stabilization system protein ParE
MLPIRWSAAALDDLEELVGYIAHFDVGAAQALQDRIESVILPLSTHPYLYRPGRVAGTRELVAHPNYIVVYSVLNDAIEIRNVLHSRQRYP